MYETRAFETVNSIIHRRIGKLEKELDDLKVCLEGLAGVFEDLVDEGEEEQEQDGGIVCGERPAPVVLNAEDAGKMAEDLKQEAQLAQAYFSSMEIEAKPEPAALEAPAAKPRKPRKPRKGAPRGTTLTAAVEDIFLRQVAEGRVLRSDEIDAMVAQQGCVAKRGSILALLSQLITGKKSLSRGRLEKVSRGVYRWANGATPEAKKEPVAL